MTNTRLNNELNANDINEHEANSVSAQNGVNGYKPFTILMMAAMSVPPANASADADGAEAAQPQQQPQPHPHPQMRSPAARSWQPS